MGNCTTILTLAKRWRRTAKEKGKRYVEKLCREKKGENECKRLTSTRPSSTPISAPISNLFECVTKLPFA